MSDSYSHMNIEQLRTLLRTVRQNLIELQEQAAKFGPLYIPTPLRNELRETKVAFDAIVQELRKQTGYIDQPSGSPDASQINSPKPYQPQQPRDPAMGYVFALLTAKHEGIEYILNRVQHEDPQSSVLFVQWKEDLAQIIKHHIGESQAIQFASISAPAYIKGKYPRLLNEVLLCRSYIVTLMNTIH